MAPSNTTVSLETWDGIHGILGLLSGIPNRCSTLECVKWWGLQGVLSLPYSIYPSSDLVFSPHFQSPNGSGEERPALWLSKEEGSSHWKKFSWLTAQTLLKKRRVFRPSSFVVFLFDKGYKHLVNLICLVQWCCVLRVKCSLLAPGSDLSVLYWQNCLGKVREESEQEAKLTDADSWGGIRT